MKHIILYLLMFAVLEVSVASVFPARTSLELAKRHYSTAKTGNKGTDHDADIMFHAMLMVDDSSTLSKLSQQGVTINAQFGNIATATIPLSCLESVANTVGVNRIELEQHYSLCNDKALELSVFPSMEYTHEGYTSPAYTGNGVVVGMIDVGVDFNHINFIDNNGNNRIVRSYLPCDNSGSHPIIDGKELPGSEFTTTEQIAMLTTDDSTEYHGTHTTGTAAGSYLDNGYHGVATKAELVVCAMPGDSLTDFNIANSIKYIFNYADLVGKPAVINMSLGSQEGAHDGTSFLCQLFKEVSGPGRICVVSAGNNGHMPISISKKLRENDSLATFLTNWYSRPVMLGYSSMWSRSSERHTVDIEIWDIKDKVMLHHLDIPCDAALDSVYMISSETDPIFAQYFTGELYFVCTIEDNGLFHSLIETNYSTIDRTRYRIGLVHKAPAGETLMGWCGGHPVYSKSGVEGWTGGTVGYGCTVSDLATTDSVISVGAYCSNNSFVMMDGNTKIISNCTPNDIAYFSGFGPDALNHNRPDVVAPGYMVASSVSRYVDAFSDLANVVNQVSVDGIDYPYGLEGGTSMSTPVVTGSIALWLEIDSTLSTADIRNILSATCYHDNYVQSGPAKKWGYGKLDIDAGIKYLLSKLDGDINGDGHVTAADITCLYNIILGLSINYIHRADVNCDGGINAADISSEYNKIVGQ